MHIYIHMLPEFRALACISATLPLWDRSAGPYSMKETRKGADFCMENSLGTSTPNPLNKN